MFITEHDDRKFYLGIKGISDLRQVTKAQYIAAERAGGFYPKSGNDVATGGFTAANGLTGQVFRLQPGDRRALLVSSHDKESASEYHFTNGWIARRENSKLPNGADANGRWVLRNEDNQIVDCDKYSVDLFEKYDLSTEKQR